ncbi:MAG: hypothetical protein HY896_08590 [Deltaproteobacteria bacterium]|nr:hypothetical protein [Deltaproteobacteria bacterium]
MPRAYDSDPIDGLEKDLATRGIECVKERFRVPSCPQISSSAGYLCGAAGAFLLVAGHTSVSFFAGLAGAVLLLLEACGFSPLDWLGPKGPRSALVVPGTFSEKERKALFLAVPLRCHFTGKGYFSSGAAFRRAFECFGLILSFSVPVLAGSATLLYLQPNATAGVLVGSALAALAASRWFFGESAPEVRNLAVEWLDRWLLGAAHGFQPFVFIYSGEVAEVKFFLAKYRHPLFRGNGVFIEFAEVARGQAAASIAEGGFLLPYRVEPALLSRVRDTAREAGLSDLRTTVLRFPSGALAAIARGFKAVTIFRMENSRGGAEILQWEACIRWVGEILKRF